MVGKNDKNFGVIERIPPDGGWGWIIVLSSFIIHFIIDGITYSMGDIYLESMLSNLEFSRAYVSAIFALLESITLTSAPISTVFTNRFGCRRMTIVGAIIGSLGFFLSRWWSNVYYYYLTIGFIGGIGCGLIYLPAIVSVGYYFEEKRSFAMGIAVCGSGLGTVTFPFILPWLINRLFSNDYKNALLFESFLILICFFFGLLMIPLPIEPSEQRRLRFKLRSEVNESIENINDENNQPTEQVIQHESTVDLFSVSFLTTSPNNVINQEQHLPNGRRYSTISFRNIPYIGINGKMINKKEHCWESLSQLSSPYRHSVVTIENSSLYRGSLRRISLPNKLNDDFKSNNPIIISKRTNNDNQSNISTNQNEQLPDSIIGSLIEQINLNLLRNPSFTLFTISNFLSSLGFFVPYNFAHDLAKDSHVEETDRKFVIMAIGLSTCFGHVIIGYLADLKWVNRLTLYNLTLIIAGLATIFAPYSGSHILPHLVYGSFFGFFSGGYVGLTSIITVDLVGIDKLSNGMGIILLFQGIATGIGTPAAGAMRDAFEKHARPFLWPYLMFGGFVVLSGAILFAIPILIRRDENREKLHKIPLDINLISHLNTNSSSDP
ncbi:unnamed protein product [Rotaria sordida]|uniref:Major facilitator superfamily (MFS) profile domain-containing protein n=1 Tax=Rotaria sordida TaxID=392033 RepID=A0A814H4A7_9BILA|nr:unnamed protein product [Rotaria sordida]CAF4039378.1 unnamed protein product [Rotaria sordida]